MSEGRDPSSSLSPAPSSQKTVKLTSSQPKVEYGESQQLPFELAQHVQIYFEEAMFMQAFRLLLSIVSADASSTSRRPITIPPLPYLSVTVTLTVHPAFTTRTTSIEKREQVNTAYRLLRLLLRSAGPVNPGFRDAFVFTKYDSRSSHRHDRQSENDNDDDHRLNSNYAQADSLWSRAEDFWAVVGWAMNCSCLPGMHASRWEYWSLWLEFMLDVLETDWHLNSNKDTCEESILWQYIESGPGGNTRARRMLRAIFADGLTKPLNEFHEVFRKELKEPPKDEERIKKRQANVNIEKEEYGDYLNKDDSDSSTDNEINTNSRNQPRLRTRLPTHRTTPKTSNQSLRSEFDTPEDQLSSTLGSPQSITVRLRLLHLLSHIASHPTLTSIHPYVFPSQDDLYTLFVEFIKPLPLSCFQQLIRPSPHFSADAHITLCEFLLQRTIESAAPSVRSHTLLTQQKLAEEYLPFAASKDIIDANCRVSLLLEAMMRRLNQAGMLEATPELETALEDGIERRLGKVGEGMDIVRRKKGREDDGSWEWLVESGERMRVVLKGLK